MATQQIEDEYDVILAGGGTTACVVAGRLSQLDPSLKVLVVESGDTNLGNPNVQYPVLYPLNSAPGSLTAKTYVSSSTEYVNNREYDIPNGNVLGGSSSINFLMYARGVASDFDGWNTDGWRHGDLVPYFKRFERYTFEDPKIDTRVHGYDGPVCISGGTWDPKAPQEDIFAAGESMGLSKIVDMQDFKSSHGMTRALKYIGPNGKRQDAASCYLQPLIASGRYPNLHVLINTTVRKVILDSTGRATGVESIKSGEKGARMIGSSKLVVVSAGAFGSPSILERSGIGDQALLSKLSIPVVTHLPGVGENYTDHQMMCYSYKTALKPKETLDALSSGRLDIQKAIEEDDPYLGWNGIDVSSKLRPTEEELTKMGQEFRRVWEADFMNRPDRPVVSISFVASMWGPPPDPDTQYMTTGNFACYPYSRGSVHINSADVETPVSFHANFLSHSSEMPVHVWNYKKQREMYRRTNAYRGEMPALHPAFRADSKAAVVENVNQNFESLAERRALKDVEYDDEDDRAIEEYVRNNITSMRHGMGTCRMAPRGEGGVVDANLNVYGTQGLKVADLAIVPGPVCAATYHLALMVGEKAADIIGKELGPMK